MSPAKRVMADKERAFGARSFPRQRETEGRKKAIDAVAGMAGLEPTISESKSGVLPLHYIPMISIKLFAKRSDTSDLFAVGWDMGLEPTTPGTTIRCSAN